MVEHSAATAQFVLPSKNIGCYMGAGSARCDIVSRTWRPPVRPSTCPDDMEYGQGISVSSRAAQFVCAGDTVLGSSEVLEYGHAMRTATLVCESRESGVACREERTGNAFSMSRDGYELSAG